VFHVKLTDNCQNQSQSVDTDNTTQGDKKKECLNYRCMFVSCRTWTIFQTTRLSIWRFVITIFLSIDYNRAYTKYPLQYIFTSSHEHWHLTLSYGTVMRLILLLCIALAWDITLYEAKSRFVLWFLYPVYAFVHIVICTFGRTNDLFNILNQTSTATGTLL